MTAYVGGHVKRMQVTMCKQSPMNPRQWFVRFACGHEAWLTQKTRPRLGVAKPCLQCPPKSEGT